jgi:protein tyrosine phosphatase (PTP) superfamily phosphohydrolase (DUF442 family)
MPSMAARADGSQVVASTRGWLALVCRGCALGLLLALAAEAGRVFLGSNLHEVVPHRVYRSAQLSGSQLEKVILDRGIQTILNLRGCCDPAPWYLEESRTTHRLQVEQMDVCLSAGRLPSAPELRRLLDILDHCTYPVLLHCRRGADRTGLVSALVLLLQTGESPGRAIRQLGLRYGHVAFGRPAYLDAFFALYAEWLAAGRRQHSPGVLRTWIEHDYCPGECRCDLQLIGCPSTLRRDQPAALRLRARDASIGPWRFRASSNSGIHAYFLLYDPEDALVQHGYAGLFDRTIEPGDSIDLTLALPGLPRQGWYRLFIDMVDEQHCEFSKVGSEPLEVGLEVR